METADEILSKRNMDLLLYIKKEFFDEYYDEPGEVDTPLEYVLNQVLIDNNYE
jgi:hypothetical protein